MTTLLLVATIVPLVDPVLNLALKLSLPSVVVSFAAVIVNVPLLPEILTLPVNPALKSVALIVPLTASTDQYNVPETKLVVVTVPVVLEPSLILVGLKLTE